MIIGIIAEYNPFHNGHKYQIDYLRENYNPEGIIIAMSGNFVQRGEVASFDKYVRAKCALSGGADLVFEIPQIFATASARDFARSAIKLLSSVGCDAIACGVEAQNTVLFNNLVEILSNETDEYKALLASEIKKGNSFPVARANALYTILKDDDVNEFLSQPNNLLALEYALAIKFFNLSLEIITVKREKVGHNDKMAVDFFASASYIRSSLSNNHDIDSRFLPFSELLDYNNFLEPNDLDQILFDRLLSLDNNNFYDIDDDLFNRIKNNISNFTSINAFIDLIKTKNITYTSVKRALLRIVLGYTIDDAKEYLPYIRLLGMKKEARRLLSSVSSSTESVGELITSLPKSPSPLLEKHIKNDALYEGVRALKSASKIQNEYQRKFLVVE